MGYLGSSVPGRADRPAPLGQEAEGQGQGGFQNCGCPRLSMTLALREPFLCRWSCGVHPCSIGLPTLLRVLSFPNPGKPGTPRNGPSCFGQALPRARLPKASCLCGRPALGPRPSPSADRRSETRAAGLTSAVLGWRCSSLCSEKRVDTSGHAQVRASRGPWDS